MKNSERNRKRNKFISLIIEAMKINVTDFMQNVADGEKYESTIYEWSVKLFDENIPINDAIKKIQERRMKVILDAAPISSATEELATSKNHERVMSGLKSKQIYSNLNEKQKASIQININALVDSKLHSHSSIINLVIEVIHHNINTKKWETNSETKKSKNKLDSDNRSALFFEFNHYLQPKIKLSETIF